MSTGDERRRVDARAQLRKRRIAMASKLSLDDRVHSGPGWRPIIVEFLRFAEGPGFVLLSAGEKWGALHLRYSCDDPKEIAAFERQAMEQSLRTCEYCGRPAELKRSGWWKTVCLLHSSQPDRLSESEAGCDDD